MSNGQLCLWPDGVDCWACTVDRQFQFPSCWFCSWINRLRQDVHAEVHRAVGQLWAGNFVLGTCTFSVTPLSFETECTTCSQYRLILQSEVAVQIGCLRTNSM